MKENIVVLRNIFLKCFFIGFVFLVMAVLIYMPCKCYVANFYQNGLGISPVTYYNLWVGFVGLIKTILIFLFLTPALALHWSVYTCEKNQEHSD